MRRLRQIVCFGIVPLLLAVSAVSEVRDGLGNLSLPGSAVHFEALLQLACGVLSLVALAAVWFRRELAFRLLLLWGATITLVAGLAPVVYGGQSAAVGATAGLSTAALIALLAWTWHRHIATARKDPSPISV